MLFTVCVMYGMLLSAEQFVCVCVNSENVEISLQILISQKARYRKRDRVDGQYIAMTLGYCCCFSMAVSSHRWKCLRLCKQFRMWIIVLNKHSLLAVGCLIVDTRTIKSVATLIAIECEAVSIGLVSVCSVFGFSEMDVPFRFMYFLACGFLGFLTIFSKYCTTAVYCLLVTYRINVDVGCSWKLPWLPLNFAGFSTRNF